MDSHSNTPDELISAETDRLELLPTASLGRYPALGEEFRRLAGDLGIGLGWHYLLDLIWAARLVTPHSPGMLVLDAGAGTGVMQWWLADRGLDVLSVDRSSRRELSKGIRNKYNVKGWRAEDIGPAPKLRLRDFLPSPIPNRWQLYPNKLSAAMSQLTKNPSKDRGRGTIHIYNQGLTSMGDVEDASVDMVVSISALEHNPPEQLRTCVAELMRVLKPGGRLIATLGAAKCRDWLHEPSQGWCYTEETLKDIFDLSSNYKSNYINFDELLLDLRDSDELRATLADFYFRSGNNGMPWGKWDPQYLPVGVLKVKSE